MRRSRHRWQPANSPRWRRPRSSPDRLIQVLATHRTVSYGSLVGRSVLPDPLKTLPISIEEPTGEKQRCSLVAFAKCRRSRNPKGQDRSRFHRIIYGLDRVEGGFQAIEIVGLLKPLIVVTDSLIQRHANATLGRINGFAGS